MDETEHSAFKMPDHVGSLGALNRVYRILSRLATDPKTNVDVARDLQQNLVPSCLALATGANPEATRAAAWLTLTALLIGRDALPPSAFAKLQRERLRMEPAREGTREKRGRTESAVKKALAKNYPEGEWTTAKRQEVIEAVLLDLPWHPNDCRVPVHQRRRRIIGASRVGQIIDELKETGYRHPQIR